MRGRCVIAAVGLITAACQASVPDSIDTSPPVVDTGAVFDGPDAVVAFAIMANPDPAGFDDVLAEAERSTRRGEIVIAVDVADCDIDRAAAFPQPDKLLVRFWSKPVDCAVAVSYRTVFVVPQRGTNSFGTWTYETTPPIKTETLELDP